MHAQSILDRIARELPFLPPEKTIDTFKAGSGAAEIHGIVCCMMPTLTLLRRARELGANLIFAHEPIFYSHDDKTDWLERDETFGDKRRFLEESALNVFRVHDLLHLTPDFILDGVVGRLGWQSYRTEANSPRFTLPPLPLRALVETLRAKLEIRDPVRVAGDSSREVSRIALWPGAAGGWNHMQELMRNDVEVVCAGEATEWEACEYVRDSQALGRTKALVLLGHARSEDAGMEAFATWLRERVPEVPVYFEATQGPFEFI